MDPGQATADDAASNVPTPTQETAPVEGGPETMGQEEEAQEVFLQMMNNWYMEYVRANPNAQPPPPPPIPQPVHVAPQGIDVVRVTKPPINKIRKHGANEFRANIDDDPERAEFYLENSMRVLNNLSCTPEESLKCIGLGIPLVENVDVGDSKGESDVGLLFEGVPKKKYISQRFVDQKRKEFLELKQGRMTVAEYEREFVRLSKYTQECVSTEAIFCKRFEDGLNEDIRLLVGILELKEFVVLVDRACKAEELNKEKRKAMSEARECEKKAHE
ncbi:Gag-Pol polyprotein [Gossypium australe]|uniref:Gag-Pol polyprotein n=1 Tax=Gossypium australe TaxID=47621 RepID=A0A5B6UZY6_9ROSI|nr:Gag-Pol polyprotein [Gossypium australe]